MSAPGPRGADLLAKLSEIRATRPESIAEVLARRRRRPLLANLHGTLFLIAADQPARGVLRVGQTADAMGDRGDLLRRLVMALDRPGVDGVLATPDIVEELALLGALDRKLVFGSMNRGGLLGAAFELDDRFTAYTPEAIVAANLDGGKMSLRVEPTDRGTLETMSAISQAINKLAACRLPAMIEVLAEADPAALVRAIAIASALGSTSAFTWLKVPVVDDMESVMRATTLPTLVLGGDPGPDPDATFARWRALMALPQVRGMVAGRGLIYPADGDVVKAVDATAKIVGKSLT